MPNNYAIYAIPSDDLEESQKHVEELLGFALKGVSSDSWGLFYTSDWDDIQISVFQNFNPSDRRWVEPSHAEFPLLLSIYDAPDMEKFHRIVMQDKKLGAVLVDQKDYEAGSQKET